MEFHLLASVLIFIAIIRENRLSFGSGKSYSSLKVSYLILKINFLSSVLLIRITNIEMLIIKATAASPEDEEISNNRLITVPKQDTLLSTSAAKLIKGVQKSSSTSVSTAFLETTNSSVLNHKDIGF